MFINVDIDIDDVLNAISTWEKRKLMEALSENTGILSEKDQNIQNKMVKQSGCLEFMQHLRSLTPYELKKTLCDLLNVPSYHDEQALRTALETVIKAI